MKSRIKKMHKINEEKIIAVLFIFIIFSMLITTLVVNHDNIKKQIFGILQKTDKSKSERIIELTNESDNIFNENTIFKTEYINLYGLVQKAINKCYIPDSVDETRDVIKTNEDMLTFVQKKEDMIARAKKIENLNSILKESNIPLIYIQAPYKVRNSDDLPTGIVDFSNENADILLEDLQKENITNIDLRKVFKDRSIKEIYFTTDHHWKIKTAFEATNYITDILNEKYNFDINEFYSDINNYNCILKKDFFLGSIGKRVGKYYCGIDDFEYIVPNFETDFNVTRYGDEKQGDFENVVMDNYFLESDDIEANRYASYLGGDYPEVKIQNNNIKSDKKILIIQDSYGLALSSMLSTRVKEIRILDLRHFEGSEIQYIQDYNPDIVLIMYNPSIFYVEKVFDFE